MNYRDYCIKRGRDLDAKIAEYDIDAAKMRQKISIMDTVLDTADDSVAVALTELYDDWDPNGHYEVGDKRKYMVEEKTLLYRCVQGHTSQADWTPDKTPALWTEVAKPGEIPVWRQPTGAQDAYNKGDRVHYPDADGPVYESTVDSNVWAPDVYGWTLVE